MKTINLLASLSVIFLMTGYASLKEPTSVKNGSIESYKYFYISPTNSLTSSSGLTIEGNYFSSSKSVNPADVIIGRLAKAGLIRLPELKPELAEETLIVNYGESGKRNAGLGGSRIEVTIQFVSAKSNTLVCSCSAEGQGETEADHIRKAIARCLSELIPQEK
ncbi:MAG TPA: hypothetical protein VLC98_12990 [Phnomibacter sp.]|nr:hypothetical protein [Phnomibacter sp.]